MADALIYIFIFPGFLFIFVFGLAAQYIDRKFCARFQHRIGPPWFQPLADLIKLLAKEEIIPANASKAVFKILPVVAMAAVVTSFLYIPLWSHLPLLSFEGDLIVVLYLMTLPTLTFFLAGWYSVSLYAMVGAVRTLTQLFAYEVPLFMAALSPAILADTWSLSGIVKFYGEHPWYWLFNVIGFAVALVAVQGKLEKIPFDTSEAETEIVGGTFTEYSGRLLGFFRTAIDMELIAASALLSAVFLPFGYELPKALGIIVFVAKVLCIVELLSLVRTVFARFRIDQMVDFCWKYLVPAALVQLVISMVLKGVL